jgi:hypothetical protein
MLNDPPGGTLAPGDWLGKLDTSRERGSDKGAPGSHRALFLGGHYSLDAAFQK